ncbi:hypothetical protein WICPIJ_006571 [Wickerhamomyces pijperi]|uniref:C2H2-type domain-containing protein n=1 Tax=Wickerhamomyces pijperi TaxID=599730 RepID=A0A9P8Q1X2_WICPI|nr:hypothetical protein WICPIJ_006571 [Wickerhamomyces pijperi]
MPSDQSKSPVRSPSALGQSETEGNIGSNLGGPTSSSSGATATHSGKSSSSRKRTKSGRTFQCLGFPGCNMTFTRSEHLARHIRKHTGERPFQCPYCSRKFSRLDNLRQHKQTVHAHENVAILSPVIINEQPLPPPPPPQQHHPLVQIASQQQQQQQQHHMPQHQNQHQNQHQQQNQHPHIHQHPRSLPNIHMQPYQQIQQPSSLGPQMQTDFQSRSASPFNDSEESSGSEEDEEPHKVLADSESDTNSTLMRPSQFKSKRRPMPLNFGFKSNSFSHPSSTSSPTTTSIIPPFMSSGTTGFTQLATTSDLRGSSPVPSPSTSSFYGSSAYNHQHQHQHLPSVQTFSDRSNSARFNSDTLLLSPYNLSFSHQATSSLSANYIQPPPAQASHHGQTLHNSNSMSNSNTPTATSFSQSISYRTQPFTEADFKTPTTPYFDSTRGGSTSGSSSLPSSISSNSLSGSTQNISGGNGGRKSWLNNVLNSSSSSVSSGISSASSISTNPTDLETSPLAVMTESRKQLKIESLLNNGMIQAAQAGNLLNAQDVDEITAAVLINQIKGTQ